MGKKKRTTPQLRRVNQCTTPDLLEYLVRLGCLGVLQTDYQPVAEQRVRRLIQSLKLAKLSREKRRPAGRAAPFRAPFDDRSIGGPAE